MIWPLLKLSSLNPCSPEHVLEVVSHDERWIVLQSYTYSFAHSDLLLGILQFSSNSTAILFQLQPYLLGQFCFSLTIAKNYLFLEKFHWTSSVQMKCFSYPARHTLQQLYVYMSVYSARPLKDRNYIQFIFSALLINSVRPPRSHVLNDGINKK